MSPSSFTRQSILFTTMVMILVILVPMRASTPASSMLPQCRFDPGGYFYLKGRPRGFEEFDYIQLVTDQSYRRPTLESHLNDKSGRSYSFAKLGEFRTHSSGSGITFEFTTQIIKGVNYQFSGKITSICVLAETERDPEHVVAVGRLLKFKKGKPNGGADVELTYSKSPRQPISRQSTYASDPEAGTGREVLAIVNKIELKAYTDHLENGAVLVSDIIRFEVAEPKDLTHVTVTAYYQGAPNVQGKRLQVGDLVRFELPSRVQRDGILLEDLKRLRFQE
jgi:hypothetical protein